MTSVIVQITAIIASIGCLFFFLKGINRPLSMSCYAVAMLPFQIACPFLPMLKISELAILLWFLIFIFKMLRQKKMLITRTAIKISAVIFLIAIFNVIVYLITGNPGVVTELIRLIVAVSFPITVSIAFADDLQRCFDELITAWNRAAFIICILSLITAFLSGYSILSYFMSYISKTSSFYVMKFAASPFIADPNSYGGYLVISIAIAYYLYKSSKEKKYLVCTIIELAGLITTLSRGAILAFVIVVSFVLFINRKTKLIGILTVIAGAAAGVFLLIPYFRQDWSAMSRFEMWKIAFSMFKDHPVFGVGLNNYTFLFRNYGAAYINWYNPYTHNIYLKILVESGIIGEVLFLTLCYKVVKLCIKYAQVDGKAMMILFAVSGFLIQGMTVEFFTSNYFWTIFILGYLYVQTIPGYLEERNVAGDNLTDCRGYSQ